MAATAMTWPNPSSGARAPWMRPHGSSRKPRWSAGDGCWGGNGCSAVTFGGGSAAPLSSRTGDGKYTGTTGLGFTMGGMEDIAHGCSEIYNPDYDEEHGNVLYLEPGACVRITNSRLQIWVTIAATMACYCASAQSPSPTVENKFWLTLASSFMQPPIYGCVMLRHDCGSELACRPWVLLTLHLRNRRFRGNARRKEQALSLHRSAGGASAERLGRLNLQVATLEAFFPLHCHDSNRPRMQGLAVARHDGRACDPEPEPSA